MSLENSVQTATVEMLSNQNAELLARAQAMQEFIKTFPRNLMLARLDAKEGKETRYDYETHNNCLRCL